MRIRAAVVTAVLLLAAPMVAPAPAAAKAAGRVTTGDMPLSVEVDPDGHPVIEWAITLNCFEPCMVVLRLRRSRAELDNDPGFFWVEASDTPYRWPTPLEGGTYYLWAYIFYDQDDPRGLSDVVGFEVPERPTAAPTPSDAPTKVVTLLAIPTVLTCSALRAAGFVSDARIRQLQAIADPMGAAYTAQVRREAAAAAAVAALCLHAPGEQPAQLAKTTKKTAPGVSRAKTTVTTRCAPASAKAKQAACR